MFDSLALSAVRDELREFIGGRVQRVVQSDALTLGMELYALGGRRWLLLTAQPERAGMWLVGSRLGQSPDPPSPILLHMRKWLVGARLEAVEQPAFERVLGLRFAVRLDDGDHSGSLDLIVEATGRLGNVVLIDEAGLVVDALKRVPPTINRRRTILPRRPYVGPPPQTKAAPTELTPAMLAEALAMDRPAAAALVGAVRGISPLAAREAVYRAAGRADADAREVDPARLVEALHELIAPLDPTSGAIWRPSIGFADDRIAAFAPYELRHLPRFERVGTLSEAAERFFGQPAARSPLAQAQAALRAEVEATRAREARRLEALERELAQAGQADELREAGELIFAYSSQIAPGADALPLDDRTIALDPKLSPTENAQAYIERYTRLRDARRRLPGMIAEARARLAYLDETLAHVALARTPEDVSAIRAELREPSAPPRSGGKKRPRQPRRPEPLRVRLDGYTLYVGRSAAQNEVATFELARPDDLWLHARGLTGGHVVLRVAGGKPSTELIERAAAIAAYQSEGRTANRVPVDVTERRHVRKIKGAPGGVTYSNERTLSVVPRPP